MTDIHRKEMVSLVEKYDERKEYYKNAEILLEQAKLSVTKSGVKNAYQQYLVFWNSLKENNLVNIQAREYHRKTAKTFKSILENM
ncbi:MAG: hypothetical protein IKV94_04775 [Clostridia bacterium]|nr:hypothetical protein [Clostridia bacterium]